MSRIKITRTLSFKHPLQKASKTTLNFKGSSYTLKIKKTTEQTKNKTPKQKQKNLYSCETVFSKLVNYVETVELSQLLYYPESLKWKPS